MPGKLRAFIDFIRAANWEEPFCKPRGPTAVYGTGNGG